MTQLRIRRPAGDAEVGLSSVLRQHYGQPSARAPPRPAVHSPPGSRIGSRPLPLVQITSCGRVPDAVYRGRQQVSQCLPGGVKLNAEPGPAAHKRALQGGCAEEVRTENC